MPPLRIEIPNTPWPTLNPNHPLHHRWRERQKAQTDALRSFPAATYSEDPADWLVKVEAATPDWCLLWLCTLVEWEPGRSCPDGDNLIRMMKPTQDLLAAKLEIDDRRILPGVALSRMDPHEEGHTTLVLVPSLLATTERDALAQRIGLLR